MSTRATIRRAGKAAKATKTRPAAAEQWAIEVVKDKAGKIVSLQTMLVNGGRAEAEAAAREMAGDKNQRVTVEN